MFSDKREILDRVKADNVRFVSLQFTDIVGTIKNVAIPVGGLEEVLEKGVWFDGSSVEGFARIYESDMVLMPDVNTYRLLPWEPQAFQGHGNIPPHLRSQVSRREIEIAAHIVRNRSDVRLAVHLEQEEL